LVGISISATLEVDSLVAGGTPASAMVDDSGASRPASADRSAPSPNVQLGEKASTPTLPASSNNIMLDEKFIAKILVM